MRLDNELLKEIIFKIETETFPMNFSGNNSEDYLNNFSIKKLDYYSSDETRSRNDVFLYHMRYLKDYGIIKGVVFSQVISGDHILNMIHNRLELTAAGHGMAEMIREKGFTLKKLGYFIADVAKGTAISYLSQQLGS